MKVARKQVFNEINITPLTDIFLVLLIIMMVVAPMLEYPGLKLSVPSVGPSADVKEQPKAMTLRISAMDEYALEGQAVGADMLANKFRGLVVSKPDGLIIETDAQASHNALTRAMDMAQAAGITKIAVTQAATGP